MHALFVAAHGAGSHKDHPSMLRLSQVLGERGFEVVRFNFAYREQGRRVTCQNNLRRAVMPDLTQPH